MKLEDQVVSLEFAKKMKELGFEQESLFWWNESTLTSKPSNDGSSLVKAASTTKTTLDNRNESFSFGKLGFCKSYSAYTVAELGEMLPWRIKDSRSESFYLVTGKYIGGKHSIGYVPKDYNEPSKLIIDVIYTYGERYFSDMSEANARAKMLIYLKENNLITI